MLAEGVRKIAGVADSDAELDLGQLEHEITRKFKLSPDSRVCEQAFGVQLKVQKFFHDRKLSAVFVLNGRWAKGPGDIVARAILAGLTPPGFRVDVRRRMQLEDASSNPYRVVQLMEEMSRKKWAAIDEYQRGTRTSGRGGWRQPSGDGCHSSPRGEAHSSGASKRPIGEGCWSCGSTDHKKNKCPTRQAKATEDGRGGAGGVVRQGVVRRVVLLGRLQALAGWCVPRQGPRSLRVGLVSSNISCSHLCLTRKVGTTRGRLELARCKSLRCRRKSRRRMRQRVLRGLKQ